MICFVRTILFGILLLFLRVFQKLDFGRLGQLFLVIVVDLGNLEEQDNIANTASMDVQSQKEPDLDWYVKEN